MAAITPLLYTTGSSYYSMIARLALTEKQIKYQAKTVDIHVNLEQFTPAYVELNPNMTIPTLAWGDSILTSSQDILFFTEGPAAASILQPEDPAALKQMHALIDLHYAIHIENFTFGKLLLHNPIMYRLMRKIFTKEMQICKANSNKFPELKESYLNKEKIITQRMTDFSRDNLSATFTSGRNSIIQYLDKLDGQLDKYPWAAGTDYSLADVVSTCLLARVEFSRESSLYESRPRLKRYYEQVRQRPSFQAADIWTSMHFTKILSMLVRNLPVLFT